MGGDLSFETYQQALDELKTVRACEDSMTKKRRPTDSTMRNVRSAKTQIGALRLALTSLKLAIRNLERRVTTTERDMKARMKSIDDDLWNVVNKQDKRLNDLEQARKRTK